MGWRTESNAQWKPVVCHTFCKKMLKSYCNNIPAVTQYAPLFTTGAVPINITTYSGILTAGHICLYLVLQKCLCGF